jgi:hypothetical protein
LKSMPSLADAKPVSDRSSGFSSTFSSPIRTRQPHCPMATSQ